MIILTALMLHRSLQIALALFFLATAVATLPGSCSDDQCSFDCPECEDCVCCCLHVVLNNEVQRLATAQVTMHHDVNCSRSMLPAFIDIYHPPRDSLFLF